MIILDILLLIMTVICVTYCWILNRRIHDLQNSRIEFARMIKELNASIIKAENNVSEMSKLSNLASTEIKTAINEEKEISSELVTVIEAANELSTKLNIQSNKLQNADGSDALNSERSEQGIYENINSKAGEKFTEADLAPPSDSEGVTYTNHLKNFIQNIVTKKPDQQSASLNQTSYYDTLRKINAKK